MIGDQRDVWVCDNIDVGTHESQEPCQYLRGVASGAISFICQRPLILQFVSVGLTDVVFPSFKTKKKGNVASIWTDKNEPLKDVNYRVHGRGSLNHTG